MLSRLHWCVFTAIFLAQISCLKFGVKILYNIMTKTCIETLLTLYDKSQNSFTPSVRGIKLLCSVTTEGPVNFEKRSPTV